MMKFAKSLLTMIRGTKKEYTDLEMETDERLLHVPHQMSRSCDKLHEEKYFHGFMRDEEVDIILSSLDEGWFLLRLVVYYDGPRYVLSVRGLNSVHNLMINRTKVSRLYWLSTFAFDSIQEMVKFYWESDYSINIDNHGENITVELKNPVLYLGYEVHHDQVDLDKHLGEGAFGDVFKGSLEISLYRGTRVAAVKTQKNAATNYQEMYNFLREADYTKLFRHPNVVRFYGLARSRDPYMIVLEFCAGGTLESLIIRKPVPVAMKIRFLNQAAVGIEYLHSVGICHGDIAARNCLLTREGILKVSDFGMSFHTDAYRRLDKTRIPVRSMAPEAVRQNLFCTKENDVYMFSVLIWEMFHRGSDPFGEFEPENLIPDAIGAALIDLYLWERPKPEILPLGMTMNLTNWYLKVDKPEETPIQLHMQIIFNNCRLRNYHHRATFSQSDNPTKRAIIPILQTLDKDYCQNLTADDFFYLRW